MKYSFKNDYSQGCHPSVLELLSLTNCTVQNGYGLDEYCLEAEQMILNKISSAQSQVHFVSGGTQANLLMISAFLRPHESVISANTGHIFTNEAGAIEATGHKIHGIETKEGKLQVSDLKKVIEQHQNKPHQVKQKLVYLSNSTELGTIYQRQELIEIWNFCKENQLYLLVDGARLGQALMSENNDLTLEELAKYTDAFYLGGTKNGALLGEAIVINNKNLQEEFGFHVKQKGAMLAKSRILGIQFLALLKNDLYFDLAKKANQQAMKIKAAFKEKGFDFLTETYTNQLFPILENRQIEALLNHFDFYIWKKIDEQKAAIRIITSWATKDDIVEKFIEKIKLL